jgi:hypothetical protein
MNFSGFQRLLHAQWWQNARQALGQHGFTGPRRAYHNQSGPSA